MRQQGRPCGVEREVRPGGGEGESRVESGGRPGLGRRKTGVSNFLKVQEAVSGLGCVRGTGVVEDLVNCE